MKSLYKKMLCAVVSAGALCGASAAEIRTDFVAGTGLEGWTVSGGVYMSPTYSNAVSRVSLEYAGENSSGHGTVYADSSQGETLIATFTAASCAVTIDFPESADFRTFRVVAEGGMRLKAVEAVVPSVKFMACRMSSLADDTYAQDFDPLSAVTYTEGPKEWENFVTLPYWQAWTNNGAAVLFNYNGGKATSAGFYALAGSLKETVRSFGAHPKQGTTMCWGMAFTNDTDKTMMLREISYSEQQWGFANTNEHPFTCSLLVTNRFDNLVSFTEGWHECRESYARVYGKDEPHAVPVQESVSYSPAEEIRILPGELLFLRWTFQPPAKGKGSSALMAIDDLRVVFSAAFKPLAVYICTKGNDGR